jgi:hypothetical protein
MLTISLSLRISTAHRVYGNEGYGGCGGLPAALAEARSGSRRAYSDEPTKYKQIIFEGCKLVGEGGAHETDPYPDSQPGATRRFGALVSHHPRGAPEDARPDGPSGPIEMLWRHFRREVTHCELFPSVKALIAAAYDFFERHNRRPSDVLSIIGSNSTEIA